MYCIKRKLDSILYLVEGVAFYPASGYRHAASGVFGSTGSHGYARSCDLTGANGLGLRFYSPYVGPAHSYYRAYGFSVRCVQYL